jgi:hypothetical protein
MKINDALAWFVAPAMLWTMEHGPLSWVKEVCRVLLVGRIGMGNLRSEATKEQQPS